MKMQSNKLTDNANFVKIKHEIKSMFVHYRNAAELVKQIKYFPEKNEAVYIWLQGNFIFGDFIIQFITEHQIHLSELTIITLSITRQNIEALDELYKKNYCDKINLCLSDYYIRTEKIKQTKTFELLNSIAKQNENFVILSTETHQKIVLMKTSKENKIVFHGSANMKGSQNFEQLMIEANDELYYFNYEQLKMLSNGSIR